jgi:D-lactate dehydrogenase
MSLPEALVAVSARAEMPVWIPPDAPGHCCATPWNSKGYRAGAAFMAEKTVDALWKWSGKGELPVVVDASSCALGLVEDAGPHLDDAGCERLEALTVLDPVGWAERLLSGLNVRRRVRSVAVHPPCSVRHLGLVRNMDAVAQALADEVFVPHSATCCGFAGDRGFLHPELPAAATADEAAELAGRQFDAHLCSNRTCEIGLSQSTGADYTSLIYLLEEATRP